MREKIEDGGMGEGKKKPESGGRGETTATTHSDLTTLMEGFCEHFFFDELSHRTHIHK